MLAHSAGPLVWLLASGLMAATAAAGVPSSAAPLSWASGLLFEPALPASLLLLGPLGWGLDLQRSPGGSAAEGSSRRLPNAS